MPTATDEKLATDLTEFRLEVERRFGSIEKTLGEFGTQLGVIKWVGVFFAGILVTLVASAISVTWTASALNSEVKTQGRRLDEMAKQLEIIIRQTAPKAGG